MRPTASAPKSDVELNIVGSNMFGRIPEISPEQTFNMIISDGWLVESPGYKKTIDFPGRNNGRAIFSSLRGNFMLTVVDNIVFRVSGPRNFLTTQEIFRIDSFNGDVFIAENLLSQIAICDQQDLWIFNFVDDTVTKVILPVTLNRPGYVDYHDGYFIVPDVDGVQWFLSSQLDGTDFFWGPGNQPVAGALQTKADSPVAVLRAPGKGNLVYVFGTNVMEMWYDNGAQTFPYQRQNSISVDYGCISPNTIATMDNYVAWLAVNEKSGPVIMVSEGSGFNRLSTDGIDFRLAKLEFPEQSTAFFFRQDGHVFYQITFHNSADNFTLLYDFNNGGFFYLTDEQMNHHIAASVAYFNNTYYFVSIDDGSVFELNSIYKTYDYTLPGIPGENPEDIREIPRMRICRPIIQYDNTPFIANSLTFSMDQGSDTVYQCDQFRLLTTEDGVVLTQEAEAGFIGSMISNEAVKEPYIPRIDMSISKDGGETFGSPVQKELNPLGERKNIVRFWRLGRVNDLSVQFRFWSKSGVAVSHGLLQARLMGDR